MNTPISELATTASPAPPAGGGGSGAARPALGTSVSADLEALRNDVEQARALACEYQHQLADKANDHAAMKQLFEKTREDFIHLQQGVEQLREERHQYANDAMKAAALELRLERITGRARSVAPRSPGAPRRASRRAAGGSGDRRRPIAGRQS